MNKFTTNIDNLTNLLVAWVIIHSIGRASPSLICLRLNTYTTCFSTSEVIISGCDYFKLKLCAGFRQLCVSLFHITDLPTN